MCIPTRIGRKCVKPSARDKSQDIIYTKVSNVGYRQRRNIAERD